MDGLRIIKKLSMLPAGGKNIYNIYRNSIKGGKEVALTDIKAGNM